MVFAAFIVSIVSVMALIWYERQKAARITAGISVGLLLFCGQGWFPQIMAGAIQPNRRIAAIEWRDHNTIVVLGAGLSKGADGTVGLNILSYSRLVEAVAQLRTCEQEKGRRCRLLLSGGDPSGYGISEAAAMKGELTRMGIPPELIDVESESRNTFQNARFSAGLLSRANVETVVLLTSGFHMHRAQTYFRRFGIQTVAVPADQIEPKISWMPLSINFVYSDLLLHEFVGLAQFSVYEYFGWNR